MKHASRVYVCGVVCMYVVGVVVVVGYPTRRLCRASKWPRACRVGRAACRPPGTESSGPGRPRPEEATRCCESAGAPTGPTMRNPTRPTMRNQVFEFDHLLVQFQFTNREGKSARKGGASVFKWIILTFSIYLSLPSQPHNLSSLNLHLQAKHVQRTLKKYVVKKIYF